jgi:hypothetical protein
MEQILLPLTKYISTMELLWRCGITSQEILIGEWKLPEFTEPSAGYHGLVYNEVLHRSFLLQKSE